MNKRKLTADDDSDREDFDGYALRNIAEDAQRKKLEKVLLDHCFDAAKDGKMFCVVYRNAASDCTRAFYTEADEVKEKFGKLGIVADFKKNLGDGFCDDEDCVNCDHCAFEFDWSKAFIRSSVMKKVVEPDAKKKK